MISQFSFELQWSRKYTIDLNLFIASELVTPAISHNFPQTSTVYRSKSKWRNRRKYNLNVVMFFFSACDVKVFTMPKHGSRSIERRKGGKKPSMKCLYCGRFKAQERCQLCNPAASSSEDDYVAFGISSLAPNNSLEVKFPDVHC